MLRAYDNVLLTVLQAEAIVRQADGQEGLLVGPATLSLRAGQRSGGSALDEPLREARQPAYKR